MCTFNQYHKKIFNFAQNYSLLTNLFIVSCHFAKIYTTEHVHQFTLIYAICEEFNENESRFLTICLITANQIKFKYSLLTLSFIQFCNKYVIIYSGASVSEFIRARYICSILHFPFYEVKSKTSVFL